MARLTAPLLSLGASGSIADAIVYSQWKGIPYARVHVIPYNPKSTRQDEVRGCFSTLCEMYKRMPQLARDPWQAFVKGLPLTDRNKHIQENVADLNGEEDLNNLVMSVAGGQAVPPEGEEFLAGAGTITISAEAPVTPEGYTLTSMVAAICKDGIPDPVFITTTEAQECTETPYSIEFTELDAVPYQCGIWCKFERTKDTKTFYSAAVRGQATPTA